MNRRTIATVVMLGAALTLPLGAQSQNQPAPSQPPATCPHHQGADKKGEPGEHPFWKQLNLSPEQTAKLKALRDEQAPRRKANQEKMAELRGKIREEMLKDKPDQAALDKYAAQTGELHKQMAMDRSAHLLKIKQVLTKEQFARMLDKQDRQMMPGMGCGFPGDSAKGCKHQGKGCKGAMKGCPHNGAQNPPAEGK
jgi:Spy/CpxP family protein refolding chaperone